MKLYFQKYQGTGNDFILVDARKLDLNDFATKKIAQLCDRRFGIGADGLIMLTEHAFLDFRMIYFNSDGRESSMCGNGGRCIVAFAKELGLISDDATFEAIDGIHKAHILNDEVRISMKDVQSLEVHPSYTFLDTGSPHYVREVANISELNVIREGRLIRYSDEYAKEGCNVNFIEQDGENTFSVRTYERGVEDETLSCGTGVTAAALAMHRLGRTSSLEVKLNSKGGILHVHFQPDSKGYKNIVLRGPVSRVFEGSIIC